MSTSLEKLEDSLRWAIEKYGPESPLVRSLQAQLQARKEQGADLQDMTALAEHVKTEPAPDRPSRDAPPLPAETEPSSGDLEQLEMTPLAKQLDVSEEDIEELREIRVEDEPLGKRRGS